MSSYTEIEFVCKDIDGVLVTCFKEQWQYLVKHKEMEGQQGVVKAIVESPDFVNQSKSNKKRRTYYKRLVLPNIGSTYIRVVIEYKSKLLGQKQGNVINAFACNGAQEGETLIWERK